MSTQSINTETVYSYVLVQLWLKSILSEEEISNRKVSCCRGVIVFLFSAIGIIPSVQSSMETCRKKGFISLAYRNLGGRGVCANKLNLSWQFTEGVSPPPYNEALVMHSVSLTEYEEVMDPVFWTVTERELDPARARKSSTIASTILPGLLSIIDYEIVRCSITRNLQFVHKWDGCCSELQSDKTLMNVIWSVKEVDPFACLYESSMVTIKCWEVVGPHTTLLQVLYSQSTSLCSSIDTTVHV